jgi:hypothetical protein
MFFYATGAGSIPAQDRQQPPQTSVQKPEAGQEGRLTRWFELQNATLTTRYRYIRSSAGEVVANNVQYQNSFKGRLKLDPWGNYSIHAGVFTGSGFTSSWNNMGPGTGRFSANHYLKQLYFAARPLRGIELQYGGLYVSRGESTEITTYDNDAYIVGERLILRHPNRLFFDEISVTYAYLGDLDTSNLNKRLHRVKQANYHQWLVSKNVGGRAALSAEYAFQAGIETLRQAARINTAPLRIFDSVRFENYQRIDVRPEYGFALQGEKTVRKRITLTSGYADVDRFYGGLNGDRYISGKRVFFLASVPISREFTISYFVTRSVGSHDDVLPNRVRAEILFSYNLMKTLQRTGVF